MNSQVRIFACAVLCGLALLGADAPPATTAYANTLFSADVARGLARELETIRHRGGLPSVAVGIFVPGKGRYTFVTGTANLRAGIARTLEQPFRIASITKPFAATAILVLIDRGLLHKNDAMAKWYPRFPNAGRITIDDLLRMRSGIPAPNDDAVLARVYDSPLARAPSLEEELRTLGRLKADFKTPGTRGVYTDFNYDILAGIAHRVTGKDIGTLIASTVVAPLRLAATSYPTGTAIPGPLRGYGWSSKTKRFVDKTLFNPPLAGAAGAIVSSMADLAAFSRKLCRGGGVLRPRTQREQIEGQRLAGSATMYGEGVALGDGVCGHSGTINGFSSDMYYERRYDVSFVISVNRLDRDNRSRSTAILVAVGKAIRAGLVTR